MSTTGELHLRIARDGDRSIAVDQYHRGALKVFRPLYLDETGQVTYYVVNPGGGYLDGDSYLTEIEVEEGASALLTTQAATKIYRTPTCPVYQHTRVSLAPRAVLELVPDQVIAYRESSYLQTALVEMDPTATFMSLEVLTPGWAPDGSVFGYDSVRVRTDIRIGGRCAVVDSLRLVPGETGMAGLGALEGYSHLASFTVVDARVDAALVAEVGELLEADDVRAGVTQVPGPGLVARVLGDDTTRLTGLMLDINELVRSRWFGAPRLDLRKY